MRQLSFEIFCEADGILRKTIQNFFDSIHFYIQRRSLFNGFFKLCMSVPESSDSILKVLYDLSVSYLHLYNKTVMVTNGSLEKRQRCGKIMINTFENERILLRDKSRLDFCSLPCIFENFDIVVNVDGSSSTEESSLLFGSLELFLSENFWMWVSLEKQQHWSNFIKERDSDSSFQFSASMIQKIYDITGYLCGHRIFSMLKYNRLRADYKLVFSEYYTSSRFDSGKTALACGMPARYLLFRQHSEGLHFCRIGNLNFIQLLQAIYMQSLTTDVLIIFNAIEPVKKVEYVIQNSIKVKEAFKASCTSLTLQLMFTEDLDLANDTFPISILYRFLITGFIRVYSKDIYQIRLSNVLMSKSGASGIRTKLLALSEVSDKNKSQTSQNITSPPIVNVNLLNSLSETSSLLTPCGKEYQNNKSGWYKRHLTTCARCLSSLDSPLPHDDAEISCILDGLIELESLEEFNDFDENIDLQETINVEIACEEEENAFDTEFVSNLLVED